MTQNAPDAEPYPWLFRYDYNPRGTDELIGHRAWLFKEIRENYEDLPITSPTFRLNAVADGDEWAPKTVESMVTYLGGWQCPDRFTQSIVNKWINHSAKWAPKYADGAVVCKCEAVKYYAVSRMEGENFDRPHTDDCTKLTKSQAEMRLWQNRDRILRQTALNHLPRERAATRFDVDGHSAMKYCTELDIDYEALQFQGFRRWRASMLVLEEEFGLHKGDLASVFGKNKSTIRAHMNGHRDPYQPDAAQPEVIPSD